MAGKIADIFKEKYGKYSFGRVMGTVLVLFYLGWATYLTWRTQQLVDIPENLAMLIFSLYGINKLREAVESWRGK